MGVEQIILTVHYTLNPANDVKEYYMTEHTVGATPPTLTQKWVPENHLGAYVSGAFVRDAEYFLAITPEGDAALGTAGAQLLRQFRTFHLLQRHENSRLRQEVKALETKVEELQKLIPEDPSIPF